MAGNCLSKHLDEHASSQKQQQSATMNENIRKDRLLKVGLNFKDIELDAYVGFMSKLQQVRITPPVRPIHIPSIKEVMQDHTNDSEQPSS